MVRATYDDMDKTLFVVVSDKETDEPSIRSSDLINEFQQIGSNLWETCRFSLSVASFSRPYRSSVIHVSEGCVHGVWVHVSFACPPFFPFLTSYCPFFKNVFFDIFIRMCHYHSMWLFHRNMLLLLLSECIIIRTCHYHHHKTLLLSSEHVI